MPRSKRTKQKPIARYPVGNRGRVRKPPFGLALRSVPKYFARPRYVGQSNSRAGGAKAIATCSPSAYADVKSDADSSKPAAIGKARQVYDVSFKAGHLLNACFGGDGKNSKNLTILSPSANASHQGFDEPLKKAFMALESAYMWLWEDGVDIAKVQLGIVISVEVTGNAWGNKYPDNCIFDELTCSARLNLKGLQLLKDVKSGKVFQRTVNRDDFLRFMRKVKKRIAEANKTKRVSNTL